jgi:transketolase
MEHPKAMSANDGIYPWASGVLAEEPFQRASSELENRINRRLQEWGMSKLQRSGRPARNIPSASRGENLGAAFGASLVELGRKHPNLVVLDADQAAACHVRPFANALPARFIECGIATQDMVSTAGGLARGGLVPVVAGFASFLSARANEQIFANACDRLRVVYACHHAGLLPAAEGVTEQSVRDVALLGSLPDVVLFQPGSEEETRAALRYAIEEATTSFVLRLPFGETRRAVRAFDALQEGRGTILRAGDDVVIMSYGPVMLAEALDAADHLAAVNVHAMVIAMPWLNRVDRPWLCDVTGGLPVVVIEDHAPIGGLGDYVRAALGAHDVRVFGVEGLPMWGRTDEVLVYHGLSGAALAASIGASFRRRVA